MHTIVYKQCVLYPFSQQDECSYSSNNRGAKMSGIVRIKSGDESSLMAAVTSVGPVAVAVDASSNAFRVRLLRQKFRIA